MKKVFALLLSLTLCVGLLSACGGSKTETPASSGESGSSTATGSVYYLNFKPEQDEAWQNLAKAYTEETGVPVTVVTAAVARLYSTPTTALCSTALCWVPQAMRATV